MHQFVRRTTPLAVAALLAGCSLSSTTPTAQMPGSKPASLARAAAGQTNRTSAIYSTHVAFAGPDGRHYTGDAVVFPKGLFPGLRVPGLAAASPQGAPRVGGSLTYYLEVAGVKGAVTQPFDYEKWMAISDFSIGYGPGTLAHHPVTDLSFDKVSDVASPALLGGVLSGKPFTGSVPSGGSDTMELDVLVPGVAAAEQKSMYFTFTKPLGTSFSTAFTNAGGGVVESVTIAFATAKFCVIPYDRSGKAQPAVCSAWTPTLASE